MGLLLVALALALWWVWPREARGLRAARRLLGVHANADASIIEAAYRTRMRTSHPDAGGNVVDAQRLTAARDLLLASVTERRQ